MRARVVVPPHASHAPSRFGGAGPLSTPPHPRRSVRGSDARPSGVHRSRALQSAARSGRAPAARRALRVGSLVGSKGLKGARPRLNGQRLPRRVASGESVSPECRAVRRPLALAFTCPPEPRAARPTEDRASPLPSTRTVASSSARRPPARRAARRRAEAQPRAHVEYVKAVLQYAARGLSATAGRMRDICRLQYYSVEEACATQAVHTITHQQISTHHATTHTCLAHSNLTWKATTLQWTAARACMGTARSQHAAP